VFNKNQSISQSIEWIQFIDGIHASLSQPILCCVKGYSGISKNKSNSL